VKRIIAVVDCGVAINPDKKISLFFYGGVVKNPARQSLFIETLFMANVIPI
jgi:hypothetical protein